MTNLYFYSTNCDVYWRIFSFEYPCIQDAGVRNVLTGAWAAFASSGVPLEAVWQPVSAVASLFILFLQLSQEQGSDVLER